MPRATSKKPNKINKKKRARLDAEVQSGLQIERAGDIVQAINAYQKVLDIDPGHPLACQALGNIYNRREMYDQAEPLLRCAAAHFKENANLQCAYADCLRNLGRSEDSLSFYKNAIRLSPQLHQAHLNIAGVYTGLRRLDEAIASFTQALATGGSADKVHGGLGNCYRLTGDFKRATDHFQQVLEDHPENCEALYWLVQLNRQTAADNRVEALEKLAETTTGEDRILMCFALAKALDDLGDRASSFSWLEQGNQLRRDSYQYDPGDTAELFAAIRTSHVSSPPDVGVKAEGAAAIFIVGMPRSGTSLVEQILASHSQVAGAGELDLLNQIAGELEQQTQASYPHAIYEASDEQLRQHATHYLREIDRLSGDVTYVTDKMPQNFRHLGLIDRMFTEGSARIIHCVRDPMATCWSIYRQLFQGAHPYAYSQPELGDYYHQYEQLMEYWQSTLADKIYTVRYERLVENMESEVAALLDWLGLDFEPSCLEFHKTERTVATASATQVRQPVYTHALKGWRRYEVYLSDLRDSLQGREADGG